MGGGVGQEGGYKQGQKSESVCSSRSAIINQWEGKAKQSKAKQGESEVKRRFMRYGRRKKIERGVVRMG